MRATRGQLCPICIKPARSGACAEHGRWKPHQLLTSADRRCSQREQWQAFRPAPHACPRCLGEVAETRGGLLCVDHGHGNDPHGPFRIDELLAPSAQRDSAAARRRLARRVSSRRRESLLASLPLPDPGRSGRVLISASIVAATLAFLAR